MSTTADLSHREYMPASAFVMMKWIFSIIDLFHSPANCLDDFHIEPGQTIIDYGCGPGRYIRKASELAGSQGKVYAVDIHEMAIDCVRKIKKRKKLDNVYPVKANKYFAPIQENTADLIYALDIFHMIGNPNEFLNELHRLVKPNGIVILEDGHQKRSKTLNKVRKNNRWRIQSEEKKYLTLIPRFKI
ncbi:MAG: class I SAM-dependent methyltransferase [Bacteroidales bacterium]|nr:class I SAM-dependent methyltransferase [Bacteroidales bacterium]